MPLGWERIPALTPQLCSPPYACSRVLLPHADPKAAPPQHQLPITMFSVRVQIYSVNADTHVIRHVSSSHTSAPSGYRGIAWQGAPQVCRACLGLYSCFCYCKIVYFENLLRTRAELLPLGWCRNILCHARCSPEQLLAWPGQVVEPQVYIVLEDFSWLRFALNRYLLKAMITGALALVKPTSPIYLNMLASRQFLKNVASFNVMVTDMPTAILSYAHPGAHHSQEGACTCAERPRR